MLPDVLLEKALDLQNEVLECKEFSGNLQFYPNFLDESVNWASVQKVFSKATWTKVTDMVANLEKNPNWCYKDISSSTTIVCVNVA